LYRIVSYKQVIGFVDFDLTPTQRLPLQVAGPACLAATGVIVVLGVIFSRLWRNEMRNPWKKTEMDSYPGCAGEAQ